jgi:MYXO-CTERM domain-containing protein
MAGVPHTACGEQDTNEGLQRRLQADMDTCAFTVDSVLGACRALDADEPPPAPPTPWPSPAAWSAPEEWREPEPADGLPRVALLLLLALLVGYALMRRRKAR